MGSQVHNEDSFQSFACALVRHLGGLPSLTLFCPQCDTSHPTGMVKLAFLAARHLKAFEAGDHFSRGPEASAPSSCDVAGGENSNGRALQSVFKVKRKSKNGEAREIKWTDISSLFALQLPNAAKQLGISTTSLKNACRIFGLHRWPGRKVRGLESTIDGIERARGSQDADSEVAGMRSEIPKLQQELDELCHGTPAQIKEKMHSPAAVIKKNMCRRLYYAHRWRSEYHNPGRHDINTGDQPNRTSGLAPASAGETSSGPNWAAEAKKKPKRKLKLALCTEDPPASPPAPIVDKESPRPSPRKCIRPSPRRFFRKSSRLGSMKASDLEGLLPEVHDILNVAGHEVPGSVVVQVQNGNNMFSPETQIGEEGAGDGKGAVEDEGASVGERSDKRPKTEYAGHGAGSAGSAAEEN